MKKLSNISGGEFQKNNLMEFPEKYRSMANDLLIGVEILKYVK